jgi:hypothetical protein
MMGGEATMGWKVGQSMHWGRSWLQRMANHSPWTHCPSTTTFHPSAGALFRTPAPPCPFVQPPPCSTQ